MTVRNESRASNGRRLAAYLVAGAGAVAGVSDAQGAIIYTPGPFVANNSTIDIDFDGDGDAEFLITHASGTVVNPSSTYTFNRLGITAGPDGVSQGAVGATYVGPKPTRLDSGATVASSAGFISSWNSTNLTGFFAGWDGGATGFIGVRFDLGAGTRYGWIELQTPADGLDLNTGQVLGYAYEDTGASIRTPGGDVSSVPEPNTLLLLATGALGMLALKRRKQQ